MVREINQALRKRIPPSWVNLTTKSFGYIWLKSEKCPKITNSYIKSNIFAQSSLVIGPNMIWKSQTKPKTNILLTPLLNAFWKYSVWGRSRRGGEVGVEEGEGRLSTNSNSHSVGCFLSVKGCQDWWSIQWCSPSKLLLVCIKVIFIIIIGRFLSFLTHHLEWARWWDIS